MRRRIVGPFQDGVYYLSEHDHKEIAARVLDGCVPHRAVAVLDVRPIVRECAEEFGLTLTNGAILGDAVGWVLAAWNLLQKER